MEAAKKGAHLQDRVPCPGGGQAAPKGHGLPAFLRRTPSPPGDTSFLRPSRL